MLVLHQSQVLIILGRGDRPLAPLPRRLQFAVFFRHYGNDLLPTVVHYMLNGCFHRQLCSRGSSDWSEDNG